MSVLRALVMLACHLMETYRPLRPRLPGPLAMIPLMLPHGGRDMQAEQHTWTHINLCFQELEDRLRGFGAFVIARHTHTMCAHSGAVPGADALGEVVATSGFDGATHVWRPSVSSFSGCSNSRSSTV